MDNKTQLIMKVAKQIVEDVEANTYAPLQILLEDVPIKKLESFIPDEDDDYPTEEHMKTVEFHEFKIEIFGTEGYSSSKRPPWVGWNKYYYKLWNAEKDKYEDTYHYTFTTQRAALNHAKAAILADAVKTVEYYEYEIEVFCTDKYVSLDIPSKYSYKLWNCEYDRYVYQSGEFDSINKAVADAKFVIEETREELYYG